jgi:hypothetical protein
MKSRSIMSFDGVLEASCRVSRHSALFVCGCIAPGLLFLTASKILLFLLFNLKYSNYCMLKNYCNQSYTIIYAKFNHTGIYWMRNCEIKSKSILW